MSRASISAMNWFGFGGATRNKGFPGRKESLRSISARFDDVIARLTSIDMILLAN